MLAAVTSAEITLKGKNKAYFESILMKNIRASLAPYGKADISKKGSSRFLVAVEAEEREMRDSLMRVFGVDAITFPSVTAPDIREIEKEALSHGITGKAIRVSTKRTDKRFPMDSQQVNTVVGKALVDAGCTVDLENPEQTVFIDILEDSALVSFEKTKGPGGLPVGSSGKVLSLLSGGIDSPVASWLMMKRGCAVDFMHMHSFEEGLRDSKVARLAERVRRYSPSPMRIFFAPYKEFYKKTLSMDSKAELVLFRRFLLRLASGIAKRRRHKGVVMGDSIGQVASQTLDNIFLTDDASDVPVFRPLVGFNKEEIVDLAIRIGTYDTSLEPYKDCCSLLSSRKPTTNLGLEEIRRLEEGLGDVVERTLELCEIVEV
jgi:thiamine biosynthesis protein ThiI